MTISGWLVIHPHVHVARTERDFLIYNTLNGGIVRGPATPAVRDVVRRIVDEANQGVAELTALDMDDASVVAFASEVRRAFAGDVVATDRVPKRPFQIAPTVVVNHALEAPRPGMREDASEVGRYLVELSLYVLGREHPRQPTGNAWYRQFLAPGSTSEHDARIDPEAIQPLLAQASSSPLSRINVLGDGLLDHPRLRELVTLLRDHPAHKHYYFDARDVAADELADRWRAVGFGPAPIRRLRVLGPGSEGPGPRADERFEIFVGPDCTVERLSAIEAARAAVAVPARYVFVVTSEAEVEQAETHRAALGLGSAALRPWFDGTNLRFFEEHVFVAEADVLGEPLPQKEILRRSAINPARFGRLTVLADGRVVASVNAEPLGRLGDDSLNVMVTRELRSGSSWLSARTRVEPCRECVFAAMCPPISDYTNVLGRFDTCTVERAPRERGVDVW